jgi:hypothetical protein
MSDRYPTKAIRLTRATADLIDWYEHYAGDEEITLNAALLRGLTAHRAAVTRARDRRHAARSILRQGGAAGDHVASL